MNRRKIIEHSQKTLGSALASSVLAAALMAAPIVASAGTSSERCADVVKGGKNSCAVKTLGISCQGNATEDNMEGAWIKAPAGTCTNIVNICAGSTEAPEGTDAKKLAKACDKLADQEEGVNGGRIVDKHGVAVAALEMEDAAKEMQSEADAMQDAAEAMEGDAESMVDKAEAMKDKAEDIQQKAEGMKDKAEQLQDTAEELMPGE